MLPNLHLKPKQLQGKVPELNSLINRTQGHQDSLHCTRHNGEVQLKVRIDQTGLGASKPQWLGG